MANTAPYYMNPSATADPPIGTLTIVERPGAHNCQGKPLVDCALVVHGVQVALTEQEASRRCAQQLVHQHARQQRATSAVRFESARLCLARTV